MVRRVGVFAVLATLILAVAGCGGPSAADKAAAAKAVQKRQQHKKDKAAYRGCREQFSRLLDRLHAIEGRVNVGVNHERYLEKVGDARATYDGIDFTRVTDITCLTRVGVPAERALRKYTTGASIWSGCIESVGCDSVDSKVQKKWSQAARNLDKADSGLAKMKADAQ